jgi:hypothetical protein
MLVGVGVVETVVVLELVGQVVVAQVLIPAKMEQMALLI